MKFMTKSNVLRAALLATAILAVLGIWVVVSGEWSPIHFQIMATTFCVYACGVMLLPCLYAVEQEKYPISGGAGLVVIGLTAAQTLGIIWEIYNPSGEKPLVCSWIASITLFGALLTNMASTSKGMIWLPKATSYLMLLLGGMAIFTVLSESEPPIELTICISIAVTCGFICSWILHMIEWLSVKQLPSTGEVMCPKCGTNRPEAEGEMTCSKCSAVFTVREGT